MKKLFGILMCLCLLTALAIPASAAGDPPVFTRHPESVNYPQYATALYTVEVTGSNLMATWYMEYEGITYNLSDMSDGFAPWEAYAGETYGPVQNDANTFSCFFGGIGAELDGATIWCVVEDGHYDVVSEKATIMVGRSAEPPIIVSIPTQVVAQQGDETDLRCVAAASGDDQLSYIWYETATGYIQDIQALNRGTETGDYITCDTGTVGTRYYVCCVLSTNGTMTYSDVIPVTVIPAATAPQQTQPTQPATQSTQPATQSTQPSPETVPATTPPTTTPPETAPAATTEAVQQPVSGPVTVPQPQQTQSDNGMPWWSLVLIGLGGAGIGVAVALILLKKKA